MANTKKPTTKKDLDEIFSEVNELTRQEKFKLSLKFPYLSDLKREIKKAIEEKD